jgi:hypothetical protein
MNLKVRFHFQLTFKLDINYDNHYDHQRLFPQYELKSVLKSRIIRMWNCDSSSTLCAV